MNSSRCIRSVPLALLLSTGLLLASCSSGDDDTSTTTTSPGATEVADSTTVVTTSTVAPPDSSVPATPTTTAPAVTTTTAAQPSGSPTWDEIANADIPAMCMHPASTLVDGVDPNVPANLGEFELRRTLPDGSPGVVTEVPSDAGPLTAVAATCNAGGTAWPDPVVFFGPGGTYVASTMFAESSIEEGPDGERIGTSWEARWNAAGLTYPGRTGLRSLALDGDDLVAVVTAGAEGDGACCPSAEATVRVRVEGGSVELVSVEKTG